ncbi:WAP four-disulfide core domain 16 [Rattus norvegicus]|uniref:WAP four-disulfide core domain 16 n=2 Tax=Rattus norvegicus TaxID=10116 RepID=D4A3B9_RAT|nr:WAP four-disulfide core domain 16 [Rattus norvegicus]ADK26529.1 WAP four-disulfide core domain protein 16 [Rattus norvegicus]|eukprot:NP_001240607.1 WAP four-disulfide core domain 16 [Rattus norvegicus]
MPTVGLMKWPVVLQMLLLLGTLGLPVLARWKDRFFSEIQIPDYILTRPKLQPCQARPTSTQCKSSCRAHLDCDDEFRCCHAFCGNVCMSPEEAEGAKSNRKISNLVPAVVP